MRRYAVSEEKMRRDQIAMLMPPPMLAARCRILRL